MHSLELSRELGDRAVARIIRVFEAAERFLGFLGCRGCRKSRKASVISRTPGIQRGIGGLETLLGIAGASPGRREPPETPATPMREPFATTLGISGMPYDSRTSDIQRCSPCFPSGFPRYPRRAPSTLNSHLECQGLRGYTDSWQPAGIPARGSLLELLITVAYETAIA